jgi:hypothetical protein
MLERLREAKAVEAERKNAQELGLLVRGDEVARDVRTIGNALKIEFEAVLRAHPSAASLISAALLRADARLSDKFPEVVEP